MQCPILHGFPHHKDLILLGEDLHNTVERQACRHRCRHKLSPPDVFTKYKEGLAPLRVKCSAARSVTTLYLCLININQTARGVYVIYMSDKALLHANKLHNNKYTKMSAANLKMVWLMTFFSFKIVNSVQF